VFKKIKKTLRNIVLKKKLLIIMILMIKTIKFGVKMFHSIKRLLFFNFTLSKSKSSMRKSCDLGLFLQFFIFILRSYMGLLRFVKYFLDVLR
jgi:hypothetical protein